MKQLLSICLLFLSLQLVAQKKVISVKLERGACFGKCPVYTLEINNKGNIIYNGKKNADIIGLQKEKVSAEKVRKLFSYINKQKISSLPNSYKKMASDLPAANLSFVINKKVKAIKNITDGPDYLTQIAYEIDGIWNELHPTKEELPPIEEVHQEMQQVEEAKEVFEFVEVMPEFPGANDALLTYLINNIHYPEFAKEHKIEGKVICSFVINEDGSVSDVKATRPLSKECDAEAVRVMQAMPKWKPGMQNGRPVKVKYTLPIVFKLN